MAFSLPKSLTDAPFVQLRNWLGFSAKKDRTMLPAEMLVSPSQNCFIPDGDKIVPRDGSQIAFQGEDEPLDVGSVGGFTGFKNFYAIEMDVKAYREEDEGEQVYVLFEDVYVPITKNPNTGMNGTGKIYFTSYTDANLDLSINKRLPRLLWVNGYATDVDDPKGVVFSWTGGISAISTIVTNVITIPVGLTFRKLGFTEYFNNGAFQNEIRVTINGVEYFSTSVAELDGNTLTLNVAPTAAPGDIVTSAVESDELVAPMDHVKQGKNYAYYGKDMYRQWWMSNKYGRPSVTRITSSNAQLDDLIIDPSTNYSGTGRHIYKLLITAIHPEINTENQEFVGLGSNSAYFDTSAYTGGNVINKYKIDMIADSVFTPKSMTIVGTFLDGEYIVGGTSGSIFKLIYGADNSGGAIGTQYISGSPTTTETFTGLSSGATMEMFGFGFQNSGQFYQQTNNGSWVQITGLVGQSDFGPVLGIFQFALVGDYGLTDGIVFKVPLVGANKVGDYYLLTIQKQAATPDRFTWQKDNGTVNGPFDVETTPIEIEDDIFVKWVEDVGHVVGDFWLIEVNQEIIRPWANFYYSIDLETQNSVRRPGEGYVYDLSSNFNTADTFEESMYVNMSNGDWAYTNPTLSADLLSEDISLLPLKNVVASKVKYPYLTGHNRNDLIFIDENNNLVSMGRLQLIEKIQMQDMSDFIRNAFRDASFLDGSISFQDDKLWITSPNDNTMFCYDERTKYWQPPQVIPNLGLLTTIGTELYVHSYLDTGTRRLNDPDAVGDDGIEYEVIAQSSDYDFGNRWINKATNMGFWEGRIFEELPDGTMKLAILFGPNGCQDIKETDIVPKFCCTETNEGNFGGGNDGDHELGGDVTVDCDYCTYQYDKLGPKDFKFASARFKCRTKVHKYEILSMGINLMESKFNNKSGRPAPSLDDLLPINEE